MTDNIESEIDARFEHFRAAEKPFLWLIHPTATPSNLPELLECRGFVEAEVCPGMVAKLDALDSAGPKPDGFEIREVLSSEDIHAMVDFVVWRWGAPKATGPYLESIREHHRLGQSGSPTRVWMAWKDGQPLAKAVTHEAAGVIGLYGVLLARRHAALDSVDTSASEQSKKRTLGARCWACFILRRWRSICTERWAFAKSHRFACSQLTTSISDLG